MKTITLLVLLTVSQVKTNLQDSPLCLKNYCYCHDDTADCASYEENIIYNPDTWINPIDNTSYPVKTVIIEHSGITNLNTDFPPSNITMLNLRFNKISAIKNNAFHNLESLETLYLSHNELSAIDPDAFKGVYHQGHVMPLITLTELRLDHNNLHSLDKDIFIHTDNMVNLSLSHNPLDVIDHHTLIAITSLLKLKNLDLSYTGIETLPENFLHTINKLETIDLSGNPIMEIPSTFLNNMKDSMLREIYLNDTGFITINQSNGFTNVIPSAEVLHLCNLQHLTSIGPNGLGGLSNLKTLYVMNNTKLVTIDPTALVVMGSQGPTITPPITKLLLNGNALTTLERDCLVNWKDLNELSLINNAFSCDCELNWMVETVMPVYLNLNNDEAKKLRCSSPEPMTKYTFNELYEIHDTEMRCLDLYGARPDEDSYVLWFIFGSIIAILLLGLCLGIAYREYSNGFCLRRGFTYRTPGWSKSERRRWAEEDLDI